MNKQLILSLFGLIYLCACHNTQNEVLGKWIEVNNYNDPIRLKFSEFIFEIETNNRKLEKLYQIQNDTFYVEQIESIYKSIIKIEGDVLKFVDIEKDSITQTYERNRTENMVEYFNLKKNISIELPHLKSNFSGTDYSYLNNLFVDYVNNELVIYFNGELHELNDKSFLKIYNNNWKTKTQLFIDKDIKVSSLNLIKTELRRAQLNSIGYVIDNNMNNWITIGTLLPPLDSINGRPLPPPSSIADINTKNIIIQVNSDSLLINGFKTEFTSSKNILKELLKQNSESVMRVCFDEDLQYELYVNYLSEFQKAYIELRNEYSLDNYNAHNYLDLENDQIYEVRRKYPMQIHEVTINELRKYGL